MHPALHQYQQEILDQSQLLAALATHWQDEKAVQQDISEDLLALLPDITHILGLGEGSSLNALRMAQPWLTALTGCPCRMNTAFEGQQLARLLATHEENIRPLVILVSQSGKTASLLETLETLPENWPVLVITNTPNSPLVIHSRTLATLLLGAGEEKSIPATKTVSATLLTLLGFAAYWAKTCKKVHHNNTFTTGQFSSSISQTLSHLQHNYSHLSTNAEYTPNTWAKTWLTCHNKKATMPPIVFLGPEGWLPVLDELRLKWMETLGLVVLAYSLEGFLHGPRAICQPQLGGAAPTIILWLPENVDCPAILAETLSASDVEVFTFTISPTILAIQAGIGCISCFQAVSECHTPTTTEDWVGPMWTGTVLAVGQWLSAILCGSANINPNHPLLTKAVTVEDIKIPPKTP